jgi:hypothetical protein
MTRRDLLILFILGLVVSLAIAQFQSLPGYMDADYYYGGGIQLAKGNGFTEPYLWNYLSNPQGIPTPSHAYWMPLASILAAAGMWITGQTTFAAARLGFILLAALVPLVTSTLAFRLTSNRRLSFLSGLLACFPIYYAPSLPVTDNYAIYMVLGSLYFILLVNLSSRDTSPRNLKTDHRSRITFFLFGILSALMALARSDGILWLGISFVVALWWAGKQVNNHSSPRGKLSLLNSLSSFILSIIFIIIGYLLLMSPWYAHNLSVFGSLMAPGGMRALWLTNYNDTFAYPASQLTMQSWLASGWSAIFQARLHALGINLMNAFAAQGGIFLFPFILIGLWQFRKDALIRFALLAWTLLLIVMTLVFPFAGARGAFYHSGAALQTVWWVMAPVGLDAMVASARQRGWFDERAFVIFRGALVGIAILMTVVVFVIRVLPGWEREDGHYASVENILLSQNAPSDAVIIVRNPPGYNVVANRPAIALPTGGISAILAVASQYGAHYLVLEPEGTSGELLGLYDHPNEFPAFRYLGESDGNRLYEVIR